MLSIILLKKIHIEELKVLFNLLICLPIKLMMLKVTNVVQKYLQLTKNLFKSIIPKVKIFIIA